MQYAATFLVTYCIKHIFFVFVVKPHKMFVLTAAHQVSLHAVIVFRITGIFSILVFIP